MTGLVEISNELIEQFEINPNYYSFFVDQLQLKRLPQDAKFQDRNTRLFEFQHKDAKGYFLHDIIIDHKNKSITVNELR